MKSEFLRKKARELELLAQSCYDGPTAQRLRHIADELFTKADKEEMPRAIAPFMFNRVSGGGGGGIDRH
jgi:hypothetical protein